MVPCCHGAMVPCNGALPPCRQGALPPWCHGAVVPWCPAALPPVIGWIITLAALTCMQYSAAPPPARICHAPPASRPCFIFTLHWGVFTPVSGHAAFLPTPLLWTANPNICIYACSQKLYSNIPYLGRRPSTVERPSTWTTAAGLTFDSFRQSMETHLFWRPKRLVTLLNVYKRHINKFIHSFISPQNVIAKKE